MHIINTTGILKVCPHHKLKKYARSNDKDENFDTKHPHSNTQRCFQAWVMGAIFTFTMTCSKKA